MHVHRGARAGLSDTIRSNARAAGSLRDSRQRQPLSLSVLDRVWVGLVHGAVAS